MVKGKTFLSSTGAVITTIFLLSGCVTASGEFIPPAMPTDWQGQQRMQEVEQPFSVSSETLVLKEWWTFLGDPILNNLVDEALENSPTRAKALARIEEARGVRRSERGNLFPTLSASGQVGREDSGITKPDEFYDAGFDASFELDIFGRNRKKRAASDFELQAMEAAYEDVSLSLIAEVARHYVEYRMYEKQAQIAAENLRSEKKVLELVREQKRHGIATEMDVERAENQMNVTRAQIPELLRQSDHARLILGVLTGALPEEIFKLVTGTASSLGTDITPVLASPALIMAQRPDIRAARALFSAKTKYAESVTADLFPTLTLNSFFGIQDGVFVSAANVWSVALGMAVTLVDFDRVEGRVDAAHAQEEQAYQDFKLSVLEAVMDVEGALVDYSRINEQRIALDGSLQNARKSLDHAKTLYQEGETSLLEVLDAQRSLNKAQADALTAEYGQTIALIGLYKSLGVY